MKSMLLALSTAITCLALMAACSEKMPASVESEIYLVRHFQKQEATQASGSDVNLTLEGVNNAKLLAEHLINKDLQSIYSTQYKRTQQTAKEVSIATGIAVTDYDANQLEALSNKIKHLDHNSLIVGHSNTTGILFELLGCEKVSIDEKDYGDIFVVKRINSEQGNHLSACVRYSLPFSLASSNIDNLMLVKQADLSRFWKQSNIKFRVNASDYIHSAQYAGKPNMKKELAQQLIYSQGNTLNSTPFNSDNTSTLDISQHGIVEVGFIIDVNGNTSHFEVLKSQPTSGWDKQALAAAKQLRFTQAMQDETPLKPVYTTWLFMFRAQ
jgi:TonB family protein